MFKDKSSEGPAIEAAAVEAYSAHAAAPAAEPVGNDQGQQSDKQPSPIEPHLSGLLPVAVFLLLFIG